MKVSFLFKINFAVLFVCFCESALTPEIRKAYHGLLTGKGLYLEEDGIVILNATNFNRIYNTKNAWLVEFYNSWCGHCHKFAPIWKQLAASIYEWRNVIQLSAIDCAHDDHTSICRNFDIIAYPTVKFFSAYSTISSLGTELARGSKSEREIIGNVIAMLQKEQMEGRGSHWPNLIPYRSYDTANLKGSGDDVRYVFLIFANGNESLATEVILDLSNVKEIEIRSVLEENEVLSKLLGVTTYPSLVVLEKTKSEPHLLHTENATRESFRSTIKAFLLSKKIAFPEEPRTVKVIPANKLPSMAELQQARNAVVQLSKIKELGDVVFLADLENTLRYSLVHEISARPNISGDSLIALNAFLKILEKYFPTGKSGEIFLRKLKEIVSAEREITGKTFREHLTDLTEGNLDSVFLTREDWMACRGSETYYRQYTCGTWTLFHYMTVNALRDSNQAGFDSLEVLKAMSGYVRHFFGCTECSKHFGQMVRDRGMETRVKTGEEAVLWLWSAHNVVNDRLAKEKMEDPEFPKIQFPSSKRCPICRESTSGDWIEGNVLHYLISVYDQKNLNRYGSESNFYLSNRSAPADRRNWKKSEWVGGEGVGVRAKVVGQEEEEENPKKLMREFNVFDISLCVVLYILSAVICVCVCLKFVLKKRHRRKSHGQDLLGRV